MPMVTDPDTGGFFAATADGRLAVCRCQDCGSVLHLPKAHCHHCGGWNVGWANVAPLGRLYSWTTVHHASHPAFPVPYTIVLVELDDNPAVRLVGHLPGEPALRAGQPMRARFDSSEDGVTLPAWEPLDIPDRKEVDNSWS